MAIVLEEFLYATNTLLVRGTHYSAMPVVSTAGVHDVYLAEGNINGERFTQFVE